MTAGVSLAFVVSYGRNGAGRIIGYEVGDNRAFSSRSGTMQRLAPAFSQSTRGERSYSRSVETRIAPWLRRAYAIEPTGLRRSDRRLGDPAHIALSPSGRFLITCCHRDGTVVVFPVESDGHLATNAYPPLSAVGPERCS